MALPDPAQHESADALLNALHAYVDEAERHLDEKDITELAGLDSVVDVLCARVLALSEDQHRDYADRLQAFYDRLTDLQQKMVAMQDELRAELQDSQARQKASRAYRKEPE